MSNADFLLGLTGLGLIGASNLYNQRRPRTTDVQPQSTDFTILTANDIYELESVGGMGGLAELSTILKQERKTAKHHITTINGDFLAATSLSNIFFGSHMVHILNDMEVDYAVLGNHEFDYGPNELKKRIQESKFKWFGTNVLEKDNETIFEGCLATKIIEVDGFKIGMFGVCTHETRHLSFPGETVFANVIETSKRAVDFLLEQGSDVIVALTHQSIQEDQELAKKVPGINLMLGGHEHSPFSIFEEQTLIHKSGQNGQYLGRIDIHLDRNAGSSVKKVNVCFSYKMIPNRGFPKDPIVHRTIDSYMSKLEDLKRVALATCLTLIESKTEGVRAREATMGNLLADAVRERIQTDIAIVQGGAVRGDHVYEPGTVFTAYDLNRELPFGNSLSIYRIKGEDLWQGLEEGIRFLPNRAGCFPQVSGMSLVIDSKKNPGNRLVVVTINGNPIDKEAYYTISSTTFIRNGGDGYDHLTKGENINHKDSGILLSMVFKEYLETHKTISPRLENRIVIL